MRWSRVAVVAWAATVAAWKKPAATGKEGDWWSTSVRSGGGGGGANATAAAPLRGARVLVLYRGVHLGAFVSRQRCVRTDATDAATHANHERRLLAPLRAAGAIVAVAACTYASPKVGAWLDAAGATIRDVLPSPTNSTNGALVAESYALAARHDWDVLVSVRCDAVFHADAAPPTRALTFLWREGAPRYMPRHCLFKSARGAAARRADCEAAWVANKVPVGDAWVAAPRAALDDLRWAANLSLGAPDLSRRVFHHETDQHNAFYMLSKARGYGLAGVAFLAPGYWESDTDGHANPIFTLARKRTAARHCRRF